jgi:predicted DNA-binding transcriptional regulator
MLIMSNIREYEMKFKFLKTTFFGLVLSVSGFANAGLITDLSEKDWLGFVHWA